MDPSTVIQPLSFYQLLIFLGAVVISLSGLILLILRKGIQIRRGDTTYSLGKKKEKQVEEIQHNNILTLFEAFKIKDDMFAIEKLVYCRQRKFLRGALPVIREIQTSLFQRLRSENIGCSIEEFQMYEDRDFLYYSLLTEKVFSGIYAAIMESFETDQLLGLTTHTHQYAKEKATAIFKENSVLIDVSFGGIQSISKAIYDQEYNKLLPQMLSKLSEIIEFSVEVAKKGLKKKQQFQQELLSKISKTHGFSEEHLQYLFTDITTDQDFLETNTV